MSEQELLLQLADDELIVGWRDSEWTGIAPFLEEDVALSSIAQNEIGHARAIYELLSEDADALAFDRAPEDYVSAPLVELRLVPDWAQTIARRVLYEAADELRLEQLKDSADAGVAGLAAKIDREEVYHRMHAQMWADRLAGEPRYRTALEELFPYALGVVDPELRPALAKRVGLAEVEAVERGTHIAEWTASVGGDDGRAALRSGCRMVTEAQVWQALSEVADPEIPVVSLVDLGVVRDVRVEHDRVHVGFTPTFLGCPALEVMRDELAAKVIELGAEPDIEVIRDDSWSTDRITPEGREKLRAAGFAPPAARSTGETTLLQLQKGSFRCPYCGSTDTKLENIFGPTPCRSIRYCNSCRQPFEQFKTI